MGMMDGIRDARGVSGRLRAAWDALRGRGVRREDFERLHGAYLTVIDQRDQALAAKAEVTMLRRQRDENSRRAAELAAELTAAREEVEHWRKRMEAHDAQAFEAVAASSEMADKVEELQAEVRRLDAALGVLHAVGKVDMRRDGDRIVSLTMVDGDGRVISLFDDGAPAETPTDRTVEGPTPDADGWIAWDGGDIEPWDQETLPPGLSAETRVEVDIGGPRWLFNSAGNFAWWHDGHADIVRYRIVQGGAS